MNINIFLDKSSIRHRFKVKLGRELNLSSPVFYNDKIQWLKLFWFDEMATKCADKHQVRNYVKQTIGAKYLSKLLGVYDLPDDIVLENLPKSFVLKITHGTGDIIICKDKEELNWEKNKKTIRKWLHRNIFWGTREWVYKDITPRVICEEYLVDSEGESPMDYKVFCFHGEPKLIQVDVDRFNSHKQGYYDTEWNPKKVSLGKSLDSNIKISKPENLDQILYLSRILSK